VLKVELKGRFLGLAKGLPEAEDLVIARVESMSEAGMFDIPLSVGAKVLIPFLVRDHRGYVVFEGDVDVATIPKPVKGAIGGVADPLRSLSK
jgi:hypothetical protein